MTRYSAGSAWVNNQTQIVHDIIAMSFLSILDSYTVPAHATVSFIEAWGK